MQSNESKSGTGSAATSRPQSARKSTIVTPSRRESRAPSPSQSRPSSAKPRSRSRSNTPSRPSSAALVKPDDAPESGEAAEESAGKGSPSRPTSAMKLPVVEQQQPQPSAIQTDVNIILRPMCEDWRMGEDMEVARPYNTSFYDLTEFIEEMKGICKYRIQLRYKTKIIAPNREKWTLRRMGVTDGTVIQVEPTLPGSWWWNPMQYYIDALSKQIEDIIIASDEQGIFLHELEQLVQSPPPIKQSLRIFLRMYPERFHMHCNIATNTYWIRQSKSILEIPTFLPIPHNLGYLKHFKMREFDWDAYKDIDDKYKVEVFESVEEAAARIEEKNRLEAIEKKKAEKAARRAAKAQGKKGKKASTDTDSELQSTVEGIESKDGDEGVVEGEGGEGNDDEEDESDDDNDDDLDEDDEENEDGEQKQIGETDEEGKAAETPKEDVAIEEKNSLGEGSDPKDNSSASKRKNSL